MATLEDLNGSSLLQSTENLQLDNIESDVHAISIEKKDSKYFLEFSKILLYQSGTIKCPFEVMLKHKCGALPLPNRGNQYKTEIRPSIPMWHLRLFLQ